MSQAFDGIVHPITAPTLIMDPDNDQYPKGQPQLAEKALTSASTTRGAAAGVGDVGVAVQAMAAGSCRRFSTTLVTLTEKRGRRGAHPRGWPGADPPGDVRPLPAPARQRRRSARHLATYMRDDHANQFPP
jgi:hypothetical protein